MIFRIERTSLWDRKKQPCPEAKRKTIRYVATSMRLGKQENPKEKWGKNLIKVFYGKNGFGEDCKFADYWDTEAIWYVDINTLEELMALFKKHGKLVIEESWLGHYDEEQKKPIMEIEIYDDYRE